MAAEDLKSQQVKPLPSSRVVPVSYSAKFLSEVVRDQTQLIMALREDVKSLEARITALGG